MSELLDAADRRRRDELQAELRRLDDGTSWLKALALLAVILLPMLIVRPAHGGQSGHQAFDWDRYHARQDACAAHDRLVSECARGPCDEIALRQTERDCSAFSYRKPQP